MQFVRVNFLDGEHTRRVMLRDPVSSATLMQGIEVVNDRDGCGWHDVEPPGHDERLRIIDRTLILSVQEMVEDLRYGGLVSAGAPVFASR